MPSSAFLPRAKKCVEIFTVTHVPLRRDSENLSTINRILFLKYYVI